jgi:hypothetical protein
MKVTPNTCPVCGIETGLDYLVVPNDTEGEILNLYPHKGCAPQLREQLGINWTLVRYDLPVALENDESN